MVRNFPTLSLLVSAFFFSGSLFAQLPGMAPPTPAPQIVDDSGPETLPPSYEDWDPILANRGKKEWPEDTTVFFIPVRQVIDKPQFFLLRRGIAQAREAEADAIVLVMDTPGGRVDVMQDMLGPIIDLDIPTYTFIESREHGAISAGAILAMATDYIYMTPRSKIGDAMPVIAGSGGYQTLGSAEREKIESYMDAIARSIAQAKGRDEMMIRAMVRRDLVYTLEDGKILSTKGHILTLTDQEAARPRPDGTPLISEGTVDSLEEMLDLVGLGDAERIELTQTWADDLALLITQLAPLLIGGAFILFYMELSSPGIGWMGGLAALLFVTVMFGHHIAGLAGMEDLLLIVLGMVLLLVEILILPGFGIAGIAGMVLMLWGLIQAMIIRYPGNPGDLPGLTNFGNVNPALSAVGIAVIVSFLGGILVLRSLAGNGLLGRRLVLATTVSDLDESPAINTPTDLTGKSGVALTPLRPSGTVSCDGNEYDALSDGTYIEANQPIRVLSMQGNRLVVAAGPSDYMETEA